MNKATLYGFPRLNVFCLLSFFYLTKLLFWKPAGSNCSKTMKESENL